MSWQNDYLSALRTRDLREQASKDVFDAYSRLADRTVKSAEVRVSHERPSNEDRSIRGSKTSSPGPATSSIRADLIEAQNKRAELQTKLDQASNSSAKMASQNKQDEQRIRELMSEKNILAARLRDRDSELKEKAKLLSDVQGEAVTLNLELNSEIEKNDRLIAENKELVDRWMARMGQEAEKMNLESKFT